MSEDHRELAEKLREREFKIGATFVGPSRAVRMSLAHEEAARLFREGAEAVVSEPEAGVTYVWRRA